MHTVTIPSLSLTEVLHHFDPFIHIPYLPLIEVDDILYVDGFKAQ